MTGVTAVVDGKEIAIGVSFNFQLGERQGITFQTYVPREASATELNGLLDKIATAADRQAAKYRKLELQTQRKQLADQIDRLKDDMPRAEEDWQRKRTAMESERSSSGRHGEFKPTPSQQSAIDNHAIQKQQAQANLARHEHGLAELDVQIAQCQEVIGKDAA